MSQLRLLIIDDDMDQRELTRDALESHFGKGCADEAATGVDALSLDLGAYDMILSDYNLPDCNGMELLDQIRGRCKTPVIMVTGENVSEFAAEAIRRGATDYVVKVGDYFFTIPLVVEKNLTVVKLVRENEQLHADLRQSLDEVHRKNDQLNTALNQVQEMAATDALTGIYNRRHFSRALDQLFADSFRYGGELSAVMIDLDGYKQLNDSLGHQVGDQILVIVGELLKQNVRKSDVAARYGGDEFVLLLPHVAAAEATQLVTRVRDEFKRRTAELLGRERGLTMSIGVAAMSASRPINADGLIAAADAALFESKQNGRDRITIAPELVIRKAG